MRVSPGVSPGDFSAQLDERMDFAPPFIKIFVRNGVSLKPRFRETELSDAELVVLSAYPTRSNKP
ncbi:MAG: hypothetical protein WB559_01795 [Candidatus Acidiferrales bacterium]